MVVHSDGEYRSRPRKFEQPGIVGLTGSALWGDVLLTCQKSKD